VPPRLPAYHISPRPSVFKASLIAP
jgi:hypothetical protein